MQQFIRKHRRKALKILTFCSITTGAGCCYYQMHETDPNLQLYLSDTWNTTLKRSLTSLGNSVDATIEGNASGSQSAGSDLLVVTGQEDQIRTLKATMDAVRFHFAKQLVILANTTNTPYIKERALKQLASVKLPEKYCQLLADCLDTDTAISLARSNADRQLLQSRNLTRHFQDLTNDQLLETMRNLLLQLYTNSKHRCVSYFLLKAFSEFPDLDRFMDQEEALLAYKKYVSSPPDLLPLCVEALYHHSNIKAYRQDIVNLNGLALLMEMYHRYEEDATVQVPMARIIANLAEDLNATDLYTSGWIEVLAKWLHHDNIRISAPAAKTLCNLDGNYNRLVDGHRQYKQQLYPLNPHGACEQHLQADVIFIHGLMGSVFHTWRQRVVPPMATSADRWQFLQAPLVVPDVPNPYVSISDPATREYLQLMQEYYYCKDEGFTTPAYCRAVFDDIPSNVSIDASAPCTCAYMQHSADDGYTASPCWPRDWLATDHRGLRLLGANYDTSVSGWTPICPLAEVRTLDLRSDELLLELVAAGVGRRPIVWVAHSMGGLIVKNILIKAFESVSPATRDICLRTKAIVFYSTPHRGSSPVKLNQASALLVLPSIEVQELQQDSPQLLEIHDKFLQIINRIRARIVTFVETKPTALTSMKFKVIMVDTESGNPGVGEYYEIPLDHFSICKPSSRHSFLYQRVLALLKEVTRGY